MNKIPNKSFSVANYLHKLMRTKMNRTINKPTYKRYFKNVFKGTKMNKTINKPSDAPFTSDEFNKVYHNSFMHWFWTDIRIPKELKELLQINQPKKSLELGCGLGRFSTYAAKQGIHATGIDFSSIAIEKAKQRITDKEAKPTFLLGDVTNLSNINEQFDVSFDIGCFHCLDKTGQQKYVVELSRLLNFGNIHLLWVLDNAPSDIELTPEYITKVFESEFDLVKSKFSRRRFIASHWYWFKRKDNL